MSSTTAVASTRTHDRRAVVPTVDISAATSEELLVRSAEGDQPAFAALYDRVCPQVLGVALRVLRDRALAEEVTQEVLVEVWRKADRFDPNRGTASGWITTLAHRRAVDRVRSEQASRDRDQRVSRRDQVRAFDEVAAEVEVRLEHWQVRRALAELSERQREAIELAYFAGHTYRDVARVLGIPEGTAKSRLRDGLLRLRQALEGHV
ncbi:ECF RNA polymerase sigma factor SigK [Egicoccus halophilus]|uniref:RNA polymerase sigma factor SigK n=1 Tax=Egicoccus halophilus TaxID=1670830 RepID=A0A8J3A5W3_9ACTN|nr:ECF RNA polymerase sigma factor SigK [Egicoccus halophilus]GGI03908.1 RNA polymerase sigma factor SigK [Egicoccus halophilus]